MLPKSRRLTSAEVREVLKQGKAARQGSVSMRYTSSSGAWPGKASVVVSSKVAKLAVDRNRLRRAGYSLLPTLPRGIKLVLFIMRRDFDPADISALCSKLS